MADFAAEERLVAERWNARCSDRAALRVYTARSAHAARMTRVSPPELARMFPAPRR